jgi:hypothetical protein
MNYGTYNPVIRHWNQDFIKWIKSMKNRKPKILWNQLPGFKLKATWNPGPRGFEVAISEEDMVEIQQWSEKNECGVRVSFDMWKFKRAEDITAFLLRWS